MLATTIWMMVADYDDDWRNYQREGYKLNADHLAQQERALEDQQYLAEEERLKAAVEAEKDGLKSRESDLADAKQKADALEGQFALAVQKVRFERAQRDKDRADLDLKVRDEAEDDTVLTRLQEIQSPAESGRRAGIESAKDAGATRRRPGRAGSRSPAA